MEETRVEKIRKHLRKQFKYVDKTIMMRKADDFKKNKRLGIIINHPHNKNLNGKVDYYFEKEYEEDLKNNFVEPFTLEAKGGALTIYKNKKTGNIFSPYIIIDYEIINFAKNIGIDLNYGRYLKEEDVCILFLLDFLCKDKYVYQNPVISDDTEIINTYEYFNSKIDEIENHYDEVNRINEKQKYNELITNIKDNDDDETIKFKQLLCNLLSKVKPDKNIIANVLAEYILKKNKIYTTKRNKNNECWIYNDIYVPEGQCYIKEICLDLLGDNFILPGVINNVLSIIESSTYITDEKLFIDEDINLIPLDNGIFNLKTQEIIEYNSKYRFFMKLPVIYNKYTKCNNFLKFLREIIDNEENILLIQEMFGYCLYRDYTFPKAFILKGKGRNGKSRLMEILGRMLGGENITHNSINNLEKNRFASFSLFHKLANNCNDMSKQTITNTGVFKSLTGKDTIIADRKFLNVLNFTSYAKMIFLLNDMPIIKEDNDAFWNRWIILDFKYKFLDQNELNQEENQNNKYIKLAKTDLVDNLLNKDELSGIFNWALEGLYRLLDKKIFSTSKSALDVRTQWFRESMSCVAFIEDECIIGSGTISKKDFRTEYAKYCMKYHILLDDDQTIKHEMDKRGITHHQDFSSKDRFWEGILFKDENKNKDKDSISFNFTKDL